MTFRLFYAAMTGALIGLERSASDRPAGIRTMSLVSLGAAAFTLCSMYGFIDQYDTSRMASSVASGVGFIGAGVITNNRKANGVYDRASSVKGLTTASAIWVSAAVGVTAGTGLYFLSSFSALSTIIILRIGRFHLKHQFEESRYQVLEEGGGGVDGSGAGAGAGAVAGAATFQTSPQSTVKKKKRRDALSPKTAPAFLPTSYATASNEIEKIKAAQKKS